MKSLKRGSTFGNMKEKLSPGFHMISETFFFCLSGYEFLEGTSMEEI